MWPLALFAIIMSCVPTWCCGSGTPKIDNLIVFGDSYTDEGRLTYFLTHDYNPPPAGLYIPESNLTSSGGPSWPQLASKKLGATTYNYAVRGAVCTNIFPGVLPSVDDYEVPAFLADVAYVNSTTGTNTLYTNRTPDNTVYTLWVGANDLGVDAFLTDSQPAGETLDDFIDCVWPTFDNIYSAGGRNFILFNEAPLNYAPLYRSLEDGGAGDVPRWPDKESYNTTEYEQKMLEYVTLTNIIFDYGSPFQLLVKNRWPNASFSIFNVHQLISDIYNSPSDYLDAPANATGYYAECSSTLQLGTSGCEVSSNPLSSFLWYDELHMSPKVHEYIATEFVNVVNKNSKYGTYY
ncbi:carbohydrate esterase family 16 protein [Annulohypoxylon bovei var. microspora]|nr:carbohydrate esterase family 16 protein [Annulohypoxylon bovei var. microspora]